ncbi:MAG: multiheme c-type cytochrome, partial [Rubripirellula sp.]
MVFPDPIVRGSHILALIIGLITLTSTSARSLAQEILSAPPGVVDLNHRDPFADDFVKQIPAWSIDRRTLDQLHAPLLRRDLAISSAQSCAASNCHGGPTPGIAQPRTRRGSEYQLWKENDPHARSWRTICGPESVAIMKRLRIMNEDNQIVDQAGFDNCLACHNTAGRFDEPRSSVQIQEGVGCDACHGPAEKWIHQHYQYGWSPQTATTDGFVDSGNLYSRARMCASCHVGDKDRDMNHDIIAAGHPNLQFEMATYHAWQPKHWRDPESNDKTYYEAQLWLAGQVAAADASLALLEARAIEGHSVSQWPELATYDCASCHHGLGLDNQRLPNAGATASYSRWNRAGLQWLLDFRAANGVSEELDTELQLAFENVSRTMEASARPDPESAAKAADHARSVLAKWFHGTPGREERERFRSDRLANIAASVARNPDSYSTWESATQLYLAAIAARESWPGGWDGDVRSVADQMQRGLAYPEMIDVSRMAKRGTATGPPATRSDIVKLGAALAQRLDPESKAPSYQDPYSDETIESFDALQL